MIRIHAIVAMGVMATVAGCASGEASVDGRVETDYGTPRFPDGSRDASFDGIPSDDTTTPDLVPTGTLAVTAPSGGETWPAGTTHTLSWTATGSVGSVDLELWRDGSLHSSITTGQSASGSFAWTIPAAIPHGATHVVRVVDPTSGINASSSPFTISSWRYRVQIDLAATQPLTAYQVRIPLDAAFPYGHARADGGDLRFSTSPSFTGTFDLPHWIEQWTVGGVSVVWVRIPTIPTGPGAIYLFYGFPDATDSASRDLTFPDRFESTASLTLGGPQAHDWFELKSGHTLSVTAGQPLEITARRIIINGTIQGTGSGRAGGTAGGVGAGPGGGGGSTNSGGGGGGYGGKGGKGGQDSADSPGAGGLANGSATDSAITMGSGGGAGNSLVGGAGGGSLTLAGLQVTVSGSITMAGAAGLGGGQSSGGGSGGGILAAGEILALSGAWSVRGGNGGSGLSTANDGGGGGGGGRIKIRYGTSLTNTTTAVTGGGTGGQYGDLSYGEPGAAGSLHTIKQPFSPVTVTVGAEQPLP